jgi:sulfonate transport system permease protein
MRSWLHRRRPALLPWLLPAGLLILWEASSLAGLFGSQVLPAPSAVLTAAWQLGWSGELLHHIVISTERALAGLLVGGSIGLALGFINGLSRATERFTDTTLQMLRNVPHLALIPLVILWFGIDESAKLFLVALGVFFPIYLNTYHGVRTVDSDLVEMGRAYGLNGWEFFRQVILPGAVPSILVGLRYALGLMWLTLSSGIGYMTMNAREFLQTDVVVLGIVIYAILGKLADSATRWIERRCLAWHPSFQVAKVVA